MDKDTLDQMIVEGIEQRQGPVASEESFVVELTGRRDGWCIEMEMLGYPGQWWTFEANIIQQRSE